MEINLTSQRSPATRSTLSSPKVAINFLERLVSTNSSTHRLQGVQLVQTMIETELCKMGFTVQLMPHPEKKYADLLFAQLLCEKQTAKTVTIVCHADTVFDAKDSLETRQQDEFLIGPGVADNKGGVVVALSGIQHFLDKADKRNINLQFVCSSNEETGSHGFTNIFAQIGKESDIVLGFEPATEEGAIIHCRSGNRWYNIECNGIEAHAGRANGEEINAAHELLIKIQKIIDLKKEFSDLKVNVAKLSGGKDRYNIVCGSASAMIDIRYSNFDTRDKVHEKIISITDKAFVKTIEGRPSTSNWRLDDDCPPLAKSSGMQNLTEAYKNCIEDIEGKEIRLATVGGASDVNHFSHESNFSLCGLGPIAGKLHTAEEYIVTSSLETRARSLQFFLDRLQIENKITDQ